jgi:hypothetical protein
MGGAFLAAAVYTPRPAVRKSAPATGASRGGARYLTATAAARLLAWPSSPSPSAPSPIFGPTDGLNAYCEACGHRRDLNLDDLIRRLGERFDIIGNPLEPLLRCVECDTKGKATVQLHLINANKSRFAD